MRLSQPRRPGGPAPSQLSRGVELAARVERVGRAQSQGPQAELDPVDAAHRRREAEAEVAPLLRRAVRRRAHRDRLSLSLASARLGFVHRSGRRGGGEGGFQAVAVRQPVSVSVVCRLRAGVRGAADRAEDAVVVLRAAHRDRQDELGRAADPDGYRLHTEDAGEVGLRRGVDVNDELALVVGVRAGGDDHARERVVEAVPLGFLARLLIGRVLPAGQMYGPGQRGSIGGALHALLECPPPDRIGDEGRAAE